MKVKINRKDKLVYVAGISVHDAVLFGIKLAPYNDELIREGWNVKFIQRSDEGFFPTINQRAECIFNAEELVEVIKDVSCCHNCCCDKGK
ncbi:hypothetical protein LCGC14_2598740 [marine sediment metagenome]|uniref:Uncharacterized protein n=1 Tax=marine sediment metagenome TaxID=412755 RepID=A0A0F9A9E6_9ZZZZ